MKRSGGRKSSRDSNGGNYRKNATWESIDGGRDIEVLSSMNDAPVLKFKLMWTKAVELGSLLSSANSTETTRSSVVSGDSTSSRNRKKLKKKLAEDDAVAGQGTEAEQAPAAPPKLAVDSIEYRKSQDESSNRNGDSDSVTAAVTPIIYFQFIYNCETQQQTEARSNLDCPWCQLNCMALYGLVKHLKMCHPRFNFLYSPTHQNNAIIEVTLNECYDGSYCGNPQFVFAQPGMAFSRHGPIRRVSVTDTVVCRRRRRNFIADDLSELLEREEARPVNNASHYTAGHHRLYFHSSTSIPIRPCEFDSDSEGEEDPDWLKTFTKRMLDEFTDVNEGEKPLMKLWNLFNLKHSCSADTQMTNRCRSFIDVHCDVIVRHNLRRNLILHLVTLVDFGVIKASQVVSLIHHFDALALKMRGCCGTTTREENDDDVIARDDANGGDVKSDVMQRGAVESVKSGDLYEPYVSSKMSKLREIIVNSAGGGESGKT